MRERSGLTPTVFEGAVWEFTSGSWDKTVKLWDARTGQELATLKGYAFRKLK